jgi:hypothetical protein
VRVVDREQRQDGERGERVDREQHGAAADPVDQQPGQRRCELRRDHAQDHQTRRGARAGQVLGPEAEREPQRRIAEQRERLAGEEEASVAMGQQPPHQSR